jgi:lauroyl/myristoyl acyltransferase
VSHESSSSLIDRLLGGVLGLVLACFRRLPAPIAFGIADILTVPLVTWSWLREKRVGRGVNRNLRIVYRDKLTPRMARRMRWAWARHMTWLAIDFCRMPNIDRSNLDKFVDTRDLQEVFRTKGYSGLLYVTGHIGVPELLGHVASLSGMSATSVFRPRKNRFVTEQLNRVRSSGGQKLLSKWNSLWPLKKALDRGENLGLAADEYRRHKPAWVPFLGTLASTNPGAAHLHLKTGAPMVVVTVHRLGRLRYRFHVWDVIEADPNADVESVLLRMNAALSRAILAYPPQWFWSGRRFRNRPPGEVEGADGLPPPVAVPQPQESLRECARS